MCVLQLPHLTQEKSEGFHKHFHSKAVNFLFLKIFIVIIIIIFISFFLSLFTLRLQYTFSSVSRTSDLARPV